MEETPKKSFRNVARRYGATLDNINASRNAPDNTSKKLGKKRSKRKNNKAALHIRPKLLNLGNYCIRDFSGRGMTTKISWHYPTDRRDLLDRYH